ncbi:hypothetical protein HGRIS_003301 [Hohenbuehelia grisea]|uniref:Uncharacterized protein n=1 Tax=Hohenbuehelia grisea TaxID=104357 RepID=A0ABR3JFQ5_9AGAR
MPSPPSTPDARRKSTIGRASPSPSPLRPDSPAGTTPKASTSANPPATAGLAASDGQNPGFANRRATFSTPPSKTRARDLLRKHYGLGVGPPPPLPGKSQDPMSLDSTAFDAKSYYEQLITTSTLPMLLKRENDLLTGTPFTHYDVKLLTMQLQR